MRNFEWTESIDAVRFPTVKAYLLYKLIPLLALSAVTGVIAGLAVTLFNYLLDVLTELSHEIAAVITGDVRWLPLYLLGAAALAMLSYFFIKVMPFAKGSGIPRTEAMLNNKKNLSWWKMCIATFIGSSISYLAGLSVGAEGPSAQLGAGIGHGVERVTDENGYKRHIANAGAAAGVACAFGAPFAAVIFVQEEIRRKFNPLTVMCCFMSVLTGIAVKAPIWDALGMSVRFLPGAETLAMPMEYIWIALIIGVVCPLAAYAFNTLIFALEKSGRRSRIPSWVFILGIFLLTAVLNVVFPESLGSGLSGIKSLLSHGMSADTGTILFFVKIALILCCFRSGATGGMMVPMLATGALLGGIIGFIAELCGLDAALFPVIAATGMCVYFGASICAPVTVIVLAAELTGSPSLMFPVAVAMLVSFVIMRAVRQLPLYDTLAEREVAASD